MSIASSRAGFLVAAALAGGGCAPARLWGAGVELRSHFLAGGRVVDHDLADDGHPVLGLELETRDAEVGWGYEVGGNFGTEEEQVAPGTLHEVEFQELGLGLRRTWVGESRLRPFVGAGAAWMKAENTVRSAGPTKEFDDRGAGAYLHTGLLWSFGRYPFDRGTEILLGFDLRGVLGDDIDYGQLALVLGFGK